MIATAAVTAFICANCGRPGRTPTSAGPGCPAVPDFSWPFPVQEVLVPCTGRLQPEHVLKAFESGADLVLTISCEKDNCQYLQGGERWERRGDYIRTILDEIGLGGRRLLLLYLPGSATEDMGLGSGRPTPACTDGAARTRIAEIREAVLKALEALDPNPLSIESAPELTEGFYEQLDTSDDTNED